MTTIQRESSWDCIEGIKALIEDHWNEVALHKDVVKLEPNWGQYAALEAQNRLVIITAREGELLVGYSVFFLHHHAHYKSCLVASNDVIYLVPGKRGVVGTRLIRNSETILKSLAAGGERAGKVFLQIITRHCRSPPASRIVATSPAW